MTRPKTNELKHHHLSKTRKNQKESENGLSLNNFPKIDQKYDHNMYQSMKSALDVSGPSSIADSKKKLTDLQN